MLSFLIGVVTIIKGRLKKMTTKPLQIDSSDLGIEKRLDKCIDGFSTLKENSNQIDSKYSNGLCETVGDELKQISKDLHVFLSQRQKLDLIFLQVNLGIVLDEILETIFREFHDIVPFNRIGLALIEDNGTKLRAYWAKSDQSKIELNKDYAADLKGSSLEKIIATGTPRIINNLDKYLAKKPNSESTRLIVEEGMHSSLTCPLVVNNVPIGFIFFSSIHPGVYVKDHIDIFRRIAARLSVIVERGRLASELIEQKNKIEAQNQELIKLNELKNTFLGIAAHDLRNPLANIQMIAHLLLSDSPSLSVAESMDLVSEIHQQTEHMLSLLIDILDVTQIESGKLSLNPKLIKTDEFLKEVVVHETKLAEPKQTRIIIEKCANGRIYADQLRLRQIMENLISNAVKFSPPGSTVRIRGIRVKTGWRIEIADEGPGITEKDRQRLFKDFAKLSARPTGGEKSVGLGLAIVKRVIEAHKGKIGVESEPGKGSTFWFFLPDMTEN